MESKNFLTNGIHVHIVSQTEKGITIEICFKNVELSWYKVIQKIPKNKIHELCPLTGKGGKETS